MKTTLVTLVFLAACGSSTKPPPATPPAPGTASRGDNRAQWTIIDSIERSIDARGLQLL